MTKWELETTIEMDRRREAAEEFYLVVLNEDERPSFVSDAATLHDIFLGPEIDIIQRCVAHYGVHLREEHFRLPVWKLLDYLEQHRSGRR